MLVNSAVLRESFSKILVEFGSLCLLICVGTHQPSFLFTNYPAEVKLMMEEIISRVSLAAAT